MSILSSDQLNVQDKTIIWRIIKDWVNFDKNNRLKYLPNLIKILRFDHLHTEYIEDKIINSDLFNVLTSNDQFDLKTFIDEVLLNKKRKLATTGGSQWEPHPTLYIRSQKTKKLLVCISKSVEFFYLQNWHNSSFDLPRQTNFQIEQLGNDGRLLYAFGGYDENNLVTNKVWSRDLSQPSSQWATIAPMNQKRNRSCSVVFNGNIYVFGGWDNNNLKIPILSNQNFFSRFCLNIYNSFNDIVNLFSSVYFKNCAERFDCQQNVWEMVAPMKFARCGASAAVYNGCIYIAGGGSASLFAKQSVEKYNPRSNTWSEVAPMINPRQYFTLTPFAGRLWAIGGYCGESLSSVESYDPVIDSWREEAALNDGRSHHATIEFYNELYVVGGFEKNGNTRKLMKNNNAGRNLINEFLTLFF